MSLPMADLHQDGLELLANYKVIVTGTHPEYWSSEMLEALESYLAQGGRLAYLGGNGFYWVTSVDPERPHIIEVRRGIAGTRAWNSAPGECLSQHNRRVGRTMALSRQAAQQAHGHRLYCPGLDRPGPPATVGSQVVLTKERPSYLRGISADETIGDFGLIFGGAAGDELDRIDYELGSPHHTLLLASSSGHGPSINPVIEDFLQTGSSMRPENSPNVHADMVYFETPKPWGRLLGGFHLLVCQPVPQPLRQQRVANNPKWCLTHSRHPTNFHPIPTDGEFSLLWCWVLRADMHSLLNSLLFEEDLLAYGNLADLADCLASKPTPKT